MVEWGRDPCSFGDMKKVLILLLTPFLFTSCETLSPGIGLPFEMPFKSPALKKKEAEEAAQAAEKARLEAEAKKKAEAAAKKKAEAAKRAKATYTGIASWYSVKTNGGTKTASGRPFSNNAYTAAHKTLPLGSKVRVTSLFNGKSEVLTITDRGPYVKGRIIDVSIGSAKRMGWYGRGITRVKVEVLSYGNWKYRKP